MEIYRNFFIEYISIGVVKPVLSEEMKYEEYKKWNVRKTQDRTSFIKEDLYTEMKLSALVYFVVCIAIQ